MDDLVLKTETEAQYLGIQVSYRAQDFYADLAERVLEAHLDYGVRRLTVLDDPSEPIGSSGGTIESVQIPRVIIGGGLHGPFERIPKPTNSTILGVRGFLTLNRIPELNAGEVCIGDLGILASLLEIDSSSNHDILYVQTGVVAEPDSLRNSLSLLGAEYVSINEGFDCVLQNIKGSRTVISDGVIGLALADSLGVPNVWHRSTEDSNVEFQVLDYFSGVRRPLHNHLRVLPTSAKQIEKQARIADPELISVQGSRMLSRLINALELQLDYEPADLLEGAVQLHEEPIRVGIPRNSLQSGMLQIQYDYAGEKDRWQVLVALELESKNDVDLSSVEEIPKLRKSSRPEIGFFKYLSLEQGTGTAEMRIDLPDGFRCCGFKVFRWSDKEAAINILSMRIHRYK